MDQHRRLGEAYGAAPEHPLVPRAGMFAGHRGPSVRRVTCVRYIATAQRAEVTLTESVEVSGDWTGAPAGHEVGRRRHSAAIVLGLCLGAALLIVVGLPWLLFGSVI